MRRACRVGYGFLAVQGATATVGLEAMRTPKLYSSVRHTEIGSNIAVIGKLTILVHQIARGEVLFVLNPNLQDFHEEKRTMTQQSSFEGTDETRFSRLKPDSPPIEVMAVG